MNDLQAENEALRLINRRLRVALSNAERMFAELDGMLLTDAQIKRVAIVRDQLKKVDVQVVIGREICEAQHEG